MRVKEVNIQAAICDYLSYRRVFFYRQNNLPAPYFAKDGSRQFRALPKYARHGMADILAVKGGVPYFLEVKSAIGRQSKDQMIFASDAEAAGAIYAVVRSIEDVQELGL